MAHKHGNERNIPIPPEFQEPVADGLYSCCGCYEPVCLWQLYDGTDLRICWACIREVFPRLAAQAMHHIAVMYETHEVVRGLLPVHIANYIKRIIEMEQYTI